MAHWQLLQTLDTLTAERAAINAAWRQAIRDAVTEGIPVASIALAAGVTRSRVYQIRDHTR